MKRDERYRKSYELSKSDIELELERLKVHISNKVIKGKVKNK